MTPCFECGEPAVHNHHVVPKSRGGTKTVPLCGMCHSRAHHDTTGGLAKASGKNPTLRYGWRNVGGIAVAVRHEQAAIEALVELHRAGHTLKETLAIMNAGPHRTRSGRPWNKHAVIRAAAGNDLRLDFRKSPDARLRLKPDQVQDIRAEFVRYSRTHGSKALAAKHGCSHNTVLSALGRVAAKRAYVRDDV